MVRVRTRVAAFRVLAAGLVSSLLGVTPAAADWKRLDSPNFVVVGDVAADDLKNIARRFEAFRETLSRVLTENATATAVPTIVLVFPSDSAFSLFKPRYNGKPVPLAGLFMPRQDANYIAIVRDLDERTLRVVFHEYAHLIISNVSGVVPVWLNEGLAEFYSTFEMTADGREALIGRTVPGHLDRLNQTRLLPLEDMLKVERNSPLYNEGDRRSVFYAQSWALTHLILLGQPPRREQLGRYLERLANGQPEMTAWEQAFGAERMDRELSAYIGRSAFRAYRFTFANRLGTFDAPVAALQPADSEALLANFLVQQQRYDEAAERLDRLRQPGSESAWVTTVRALLDATRTDYASSQKRLSSLKTVDDWLLGYFAGSTLADVLESRGGTEDAAHRETVRRFFEVALKGGKEIPNVLARAAALDLLEREPPTYQTIASIQRAMKLAPGRTDYLFLYARALAQQSSYAAAANVLRVLTTTAYPPHVRDSARRILEEIQTFEKAHTSTATTPGGSGAAPASDRDRERVEPAQTGAAEAVFRTLGEDEQRIEGVLQRIECGRNGAVFHVQTADGPAQARTAKMEHVEFITYRDDVSSTIKCGALKEPMPVYLTWRPSTDGKGRIAVAVEFRPK